MKPLLSFLLLLFTCLCFSCGDAKTNQGEGTEEEKELAVSDSIASELEKDMEEVEQQVEEVENTVDKLLEDI